MFITIEGIDGAGKTEQARRLERYLMSQNRDVLLTREPGGCAVMVPVRNLVLTGPVCHAMTELLLFLADRCEHVAQTIDPALQAGKTVICERYNDSTLAYQCWGRKLDRRMVSQLIADCHLPEPDVTLWFDLPLDEAARRRHARSADDRIEAEAVEFHRRIAAGFGALAQENERIVRIDASGTPEKVAAHVLAALHERGVL